ncbi:hypothetical protein HZB58_00255, partial [Candidatus Gottesmanbacteria bacterium]|nr:hypothetical protein [Candidatus Gottesmanbacteria bacterium]
MHLRKWALPMCGCIAGQTSFLSQLIGVKEMAVVSQTQVQLVPVGIDGAGTVLNTRSLNEAFASLAQSVSARTTEQLLTNYVRTPNSLVERLKKLFRPSGEMTPEQLADGQFLLNYLNPFDKRGIERLYATGATETEIVELKVHYRETEPGAGIPINENAAHATLIRILNRINRDTSWFVRMWQSAVSLLRGEQADHRQEYLRGIDRLIAQADELNRVLGPSPSATALQEHTKQIISIREAIDAIIRQ